MCALQGYVLRKGKGKGNEKDTKANTEKSIIKLYPNPANDKVTLEHNIKGKNIVFEIYSVTEQRVMQIPLNEDVKQIQFSTVKLKPAIYFYHIKNKDALILSGKLIIIK